VPSVATGSAFVYELVLTAALMFVIMAVATDTRAQGAAAAIAIGGTVGLDAIMGGPVSGASMNPARSLGPALAAGQWTDFWVYLAGPILGAGVGALAYQLVRGRSTTAPEETAADGARPVRLPA
jgi:aquaporin NIP